MSKRLIGLLGLVFMLQVPERAQAFLPYLISGSGADYAVIDPERNIVVSTGSLKTDLLSATTEHPELSKMYLLDGWYADAAHDRAVFNWGRFGEYDDGMPIYAGKLIIRLSDRRLLFSFEKDGGRWLPYHKVSPLNKLVTTGARDDDFPNTRMYDGETYSEIVSSVPLKFGVIDRFSCFIPGTAQLYDGFYWERGVYDVNKNELVFSTREIFKKTDELDCQSGLVLSYVRKGKSKPGKELFQIYNLKERRVQAEILPDDAISKSRDEWRLSSDGKYAVWSEQTKVGVVGGAGNFETGRFAFYNTETGKKTGEVKLTEKNWEDYQFGTSTWVNGFSLDGKKLLVCSSPYLYVIDIGSAKVLHKVKIPFTPGNNGEGFVVWP